MTENQSAPAQVKTLTGTASQDIVRLGLESGIAGNLYHLILVMTWRRFFGLFGAAYVAINALFAALYLLGGDGALSNARPGSFADAFYFSVHTMATIGYGTIAPNSTFTNVVVAVEAFVGLVSTAVATGLVFAKFARPSANVLFTDVATVQMRDGAPHLAIRVANKRDARIVDAQFKMLIQLDTVTAEGDRIRKFHEMKLLNGRSPLLYLSWTLLHRIDADSPLAGHTAESLRRLNAELLVTVMGLDEVFVQTIHARHSYVVGELRWGEQFVDMLERPPGGTMVVDYTKFHQTRRQNVPPPVL